MPIETKSRLDVWELFDPRLIPSDGDLHSYLSHMLSLCAEWFQASSASLFLRERDHYSLAAQLASKHLIPLDAKIIVGQGVAGASIERRRAMLVKDPRREPSLARRVSGVREDLSSAIVVPLLLPDQGCLGVMNLSRGAGAEEFVSQDVRRATAVGHQLALALGNAQLMVEARAARDDLRAVIDTLTVAVFVSDEVGRIVEHNAAAKQFLATYNLTTWLPEALRGKWIGAIDGPARIVDQGQVWWVTSTPTATGNLVTVQNVTEHEKEQQNAARTRRLAEIGQMTAAVAHEIRNPLTGIHSAAQMMTQMPEMADEFSRMIQEEVGKLNRLCEEFLEFARPLAIRMGDVRLVDIATKTVSLVQCEFDQCDVHLKVEIGPDKPTIQGDALRIEQVLRNLLRNALQACKKGGQVTLRVRARELEVEDDGCGMSKEQVEHLFTPFFTTKAKGTGLGLSNVRKIIDAHDGKIEVWSTPEQGSRFTVKLWLRGVQ